MTKMTRIEGLNNHTLLERIVEGKCFATGHSNTFIPQATWVQERLEGQKLLAEELVRCKDCRHITEWNKKSNTKFCEQHGIPVSLLDFFCADGVR